MFPNGRAPYFVLSGLVLVAALAFAACGDDDEDGGRESGEVNVSLSEYQVTLDVTSAPAGDVKFVASNDGSEEHEMVVVRTDLDPADLPTQDDGSVDEEADGIEVIGEIEDIEPDNTDESTLNLEPGKYVLLCNIVEEDNGESHYQEGMYTGFTVE